MLDNKLLNNWLLIVLFKGKNGYPYKVGQHYRLSRSKRLSRYLLKIRVSNFTRVAEKTSEMRQYGRIKQKQKVSANGTAF